MAAQMSPFNALQASDKGTKHMAELKNRLAEAEAQAQKDAAACADARQEASHQQVETLLTLLSFSRNSQFRRDCTQFCGMVAIT